MVRLAGPATVLAFAAATGVTYGLKLRATPLPTPIFIVLTILFVTSGSLVVSYIGVRAYMGSKFPSILFLASGSLTFGVTTFVAAIFGLAAGLPGSNAGATTFVVGAFLSSISDLMCGFSIARGERDRRAFRVAAVLVFKSMIVASVLLVASAYAGVLPTFLVPGRGATVVAKGVLSLAITTMGIAAAIIAAYSSKSEVLYLYSSALAVTAVGLADLLLSDWTFVSMAFLTGRLALCAGGAFLVLSVLSAERQAAKRTDVVVQELFRP